MHTTYKRHAGGIMLLKTDFGFVAVKVQVLHSTAVCSVFVLHMHMNTVQFGRRLALDS